jgi:hypothetical protein
MWLLSWASRRVGGLSLVSLLFLCYWVISSQIRSIGDDANSSPKTVVFFAYYSLLIHFMVVIFPIRACWAAWDITWTLKKMIRTRNWKESSPIRRSSSTSSSFSNAGTLTPTQASDSSISGDAGEVESGYFADLEVELPKNIHAILIPNYKEEYHVLEETLSVLASHTQARGQYDVSSASTCLVVNQLTAPDLPSNGSTGEGL